MLYEVAKFGVHIVVQCAVCSVQCLVFIVQCVVCNVKYTVCSVQCSVCSVQYAACIVLASTRVNTKKKICEKEILEAEDISHLGAQVT